MWNTPLVLVCVAGATLLATQDPAPAQGAPGSDAQARNDAEEKFIAFSSIGLLYDENGALIPFDQLPEEISRAIRSFEVIETRRGNELTVKYKYRFWDKGKSLERISKHLGLYERDHGKQGGVQVIVVDHKDIVKET